MAQRGLYVLAALALAASVSSCGERPTAASSLEVRLPEYGTTGFAHRMFAAYANVPSRLRFVNVPTTKTTAEVFERGEVDIAATSADAAYFLFRESRQGGNGANQVRAIAALQQVPMHLLVRGRTDVRRARDIHGIGYMQTTPVSNRVAERVIRELGIAEAAPFPSAHVPERVTFPRPDVDGVLVSSDYPSAIVERLLNEGARLLDIDDDAIARLQRDYPFIRGMAIPAGTYAGQPDAIHTIGISMMLVCRKGLADDIVHELTRHLFTVIATLRTSYPELRRLEFRHAIATTIPLHPGAAAYYREMELGP